MYVSVPCYWIYGDALMSDANILTLGYILLLVCGIFCWGFLLNRAAKRIAIRRIKEPTTRPFDWTS